MTVFESIDAVSISTQTISNATHLIDASVQTDPMAAKRTRDVHLQTCPQLLNQSENEDSQDISDNINGVASPGPFHYPTSETSSPPNTNTPDPADVSSRNLPIENDLQNNSINDDDTDSDQELSPEDLRKLMEEINQSTRRKSPIKSPVSRNRKIYITFYLQYFWS